MESYTDYQAAYLAHALTMEEEILREALQLSEQKTTLATTVAAKGTWLVKAVSDALLDGAFGKRLSYADLVMG